MPVLGLHHAQAFCPPGGEAQARRFYAGQLGLREIPKPDSLRENGGCWFEAPGGGQVYLSTETDLHLHPRRHFAFRVDDVARMRRELESQGVQSEDASEITGWTRCYYAAAKPSRGASSAYVFDPFGNKIELDQTE